MSELTFNTTEGQNIDRELLILFLNTSTTSSPVWSPVGCGVEDSSTEYDWARSSAKDIIGHTHSTMKKPILTQSFEPWPLRNGDAAQKKLWNLAVKDQDAMALSSQDCLLVHKYAGTANTAMFAERYDSCAIEISSLGGEGGGNISMPIGVTFGGERSVGTVAVGSDGAVTFTVDTSANG